MPKQDMLPPEQLTPPRTRGFRAYPLHSIPADWAVELETLRDATSAKRIKENMVRQTRAGVESAYVAIFAGADPPLVHLRLAKLTVDAIERLDSRTGEEELIEAKEGQFFTESVHLVVNTSNGIAMGEYRPNSLSVLGKWPGILISSALSKLGTVAATAAQPVTFEAYPTVDFLERAIGRAVKKFHLKIGPVSPELAERAGVASDVIEQLTLGGNIMAFDLELAITPRGPVNEGIAQMLAGLAGRLHDVGASQLAVTMEDKEVFDLLNDNLVYYSARIEAPPRTGQKELRVRTLNELRSLLLKNQAGLLAMTA
jgi:hypothetical protein